MKNDGSFAALTGIRVLVVHLHHIRNQRDMSCSALRFFYGNFGTRANKNPVTVAVTGYILVRSTGLEPVPVAGHAPQTCAYADSATTAGEQVNYKTDCILCQA